MTSTRHLLLALLSVACAAPRALAVPPELVSVVAKPLARTVELPGELAPFFAVELHAKVAGYVDRVLVDRGSVVKQGDLLVELSAPEIAAQRAEAAAKLQAAQAERAQAEAQLAAAESTFERLQRAAQTPGAIAGNELVLAEKQRDAAHALVAAREQAVHAAEAAERALTELASYLKIAAPFDGVVTERLVHPGAFAGAGGNNALLVVQQVARLRLIVPVPEEDVGGVVKGAAVSFRVPAWPERTFLGTVARVAHSLDPKTRTMAVELDVSNRDGALAPGMFPAVQWPVRSARAALFVPKTSVVTTTERTFVVRATEGRAEWVDVKKGAVEGDLVEVFGKLRGGDRVVRRATDEIRAGTALQ